MWLWWSFHCLQFNKVHLFSKHLIGRLVLKSSPIAEYTVVDNWKLAVGSALSWWHKTANKFLYVGFLVLYNMVLELRFYLISNSWRWLPQLLFIRLLSSTRLWRAIVTPWILVEMPKEVVVYLISSQARDEYPWWRLGTETCSMNSDSSTSLTAEMTHSDTMVHPISIL